MDLGEILLTIENIDESVRLVNLQILKLKQDLKEYQKKRNEQETSILARIDTIAKLQKKQQENNLLMLSLQNIK